jgi:hypothetical protein
MLNDGQTEKIVKELPLYRYSSDLGAKHSAAPTPPWRHYLLCSFLRLYTANQIFSLGSLPIVLQCKPPFPAVASPLDAYAKGRL